MFHNITLKEIGTALMVIRKQRRMSQDELAESAGLSRAIVSLVELGKGNPTIDTLEAMAKALGVTIRAMVNERG